MASSFTELSRGSWDSGMEVEENNGFNGGERTSQSSSKFCHINAFTSAKNNKLQQDDIEIAAGFGDSLVAKVIKENSAHEETIPIPSARLRGSRDSGFFGPQANYDTPMVGKLVIGNRFQIFVKNFDGRSSTYKVENKTKVITLMEEIQSKVGIPPDQQILNYAGRNLEKNKTIQDYNIKPESTLFLTGRLRGG